MKIRITSKFQSLLFNEQFLVIFLAFLSIIINILPLNISTDFKNHWNDIFWTLFSLITVFKAFQTANKCIGNFKSAWQFIAFGCLFWFIGMLIWDYYRFLHNTFPPYPSLADVGYLLMAPLITFGIIYFRQEKVTVNFMLYQIVRIGVIFSTLLIIHFLIYGTLIENKAVSNLYIITSLSYPLLFFTTVIHGISDTWYKYNIKSQQIILLIVSGMLLLALANAEYAYSLLALEYYSIVYVDIAWTIGFLPIYFAAVLQQRNHKDIKQKTHPLIIKLSELINKSFLPLLLLSLSITIIFNRKQISLELLDGFLLLIAVFTILLVGYILLSEQKERSFDSQLYAKDLMLNSLVETIPYGIQECDLKGNIIYCNESMYKILSALPNSLIRRKLWHCAISKKQQKHQQQLFQKIIAEHPKPESLIEPSLSDDGRLLFLKNDWNYRCSPNGKLISIVSVITDITTEKHNEEKLKQAATVFSSTTDAVIIADKECNILVVNNAFINITGNTKEEVMGENPKILHSNRHPDEFYNAMWDHLNKEGSWHGEIWNIKKNGDYYLTWTRITSVTDDMNNIINYVLVFSDITKIKQSEEHLKFLALHDALTLLPNRTSLALKLEQTIHRSERREQQFAVYFIDLDQFKHINDSLGHAIGDRILVKTSERLKKIARNEDTVSRLGGDEFVFIAETIESIHDSSKVAERIIQIFNASFDIDDLQLHVTPSIGIALYPDNGITPEELLKNADAAMYRAKLDGRNSFSYYSEELTTKASERIKYENMLRKAVENGELTLHYQPQIDIVQKQIHGIEVLLRWEHPEEGMISPSTFIPIAEDSGLICTIGQWVLQQSCQFMKQLLSEGIELKHISVNVSGIQFLRGQFVDSVEQLLKEIGLEGRYLELEITESVIMNDKIKSIEALNKLAKMGISLSIDDFGTGYSSLSYLKKLPINCIKIDQSFIHDIPENKDDEAITKSIIALGNALNLEIIAEGVEQMDQLAFLRKEGCSLIQGYLISQPIKDEELIALLKQSEILIQKFS